MKNKICIIITILTVIMISCKNQEDSEFTDWPIIESYLSPGNYFNLKISRQVPFSTNVKYSTDDINNLIIHVENNDKIYTLTPLGEGKYIDSSLVVKEGEQYNLSFIFNSKVVTAYTTIPSKPEKFSESDTEIYLTKMDSTSTPTSMTMPDPLKLTWINTDAAYYLVIIENTETTLEPIRDFGDETPPGNRFRKSPVTSSGLYINSMEFQYFGKHRLILFHVLADYATLYNQNSTSSQNLTNPSTSIVNGYGIFTGLNSDTLYFEVKEQ